MAIDKAAHDERIRTECVGEGTDDGLEREGKRPGAEPNCSAVENAFEITRKRLEPSEFYRLRVRRNDVIGVAADIDEDPRRESRTDNDVANPRQRLGTIVEQRQALGADHAQPRAAPRNLLDRFFKPADARLIARRRAEL
ncbi:MAG TPA: hypothetical protein VGN14_13550 [Candidatus Elarobacter sp.]